MRILYLAPALALLLFPACDSEPPTPEVASTGNQAASVDPRMRAAITRHLELLDLAGLPDRLLESMITRMKTAPNLPDGLIDRVRAAAVDEPVQDLLIRFVAARLEEGEIDVQELEAVNEFYASPVGRKYAAAQPAIVQGTGDFVRTWATQLSVKASDAGLRMGQNPGK